MWGNGLRQSSYVTLKRHDVALDLFNALMLKFIDPAGDLAHVFNGIELCFGHFGRQRRRQLKRRERLFPLLSPARPLRRRLFESFALAGGITGGFAQRRLKIASGSGSILISFFDGCDGLDHNIQRLRGKGCHGNTQDFKFQVNQFPSPQLPGAAGPRSGRSPAASCG